MRRSTQMDKGSNETFEAFVEKVYFALKFDYLVDVKLSKLLNDEAYRSLLLFYYDDFNAEETALLIACEKLKIIIRKNEKDKSEEIIDRINIFSCYLNERGKVSQAFFKLLNEKVKELESMMLWRFAKSASEITNSELGIDCDKASEIDKTLKSIK